MANTQALGEAVASVLAGLQERPVHAEGLHRAHSRCTLNDKDSPPSSPITVVPLPFYVGSFTCTREGRTE